MKANFFIAIVIALLSFSCSDDDNNSNSTSLSQEEKDGLLYMLEEEKLARDTYIYMNNLWGLNQFNNIKNSEQSHMDAIVSILEQNDIEYTILPQGEFSYQNLQDLYNQFVINGQVSSESALQIGATIEDLDIVDLEDYINDSTNSVLISTYENLQCGSRNHLRSFVTAIENLGFTYTPQFLTLEEYEAILNSIQEQCN
ncbi:DUF2202 domain-containing protein [Flavobacterium sp.]|jgi:hypothetical protein|uniref:DUF2202 domain-containing protein n=1 Tax=Flavobacterium sp. TaxID=239 RepID=UPI0037BF48BB